MVDDIHHNFQGHFTRYDAMLRQEEQVESKSNETLLSLVNLKFTYFLFTQKYRNEM